MHKVKRLIENLKRLAGVPSAQTNGLDNADMFVTLGEACLDLDTRLKALERNTHGDGR